MQSALGAARLLTLIGPGGCGKTRLGVEVARRVASDFDGDVVWVDLAPLPEGSAVTAAIARAIDVQASPGGSVLEALTAGLQNRRSLIFIDNCEHVVGSVVEPVMTLLQDTEDIKILATSRSPLDIEGEQTWPVPSLGLPPHGAASGDAVRLFVERARLVGVEVVPDDHEMPAVVEICRRLDGIPLAIELAAARLRMLSPAQLAARLDEALVVVGHGARTAPPRQRTLRASIDWSHDLLETPARVLLRRLAVFEGGFTLELAADVCHDEQLPRHTVLPALTELVEHSLVQVASIDGEAARCRLLEVVRQYAMTSLENAGERELLEGRHARALLEFACDREQALLGPDQPDLLAVFDDEDANFDAARRCLEATDPDSALQLCLVLWIWRRARGRYVEWATVMKSALETADESSPWYARALAGFAWMASSHGDWNEGLPAAREALALAESRDDRRSVAEALLVIANLLAVTDPAASRPLLARCQTIGEELVDDWILQRCDLYWAMADWCQQRTQDCLARVRRQRERASRIADRRTLSLTVAFDGYARYAMLDHAEAVERLDEAIALAREVADPLAELAAQLHLAMFDVSAGRCQPALTQLQALQARLLPSGAAAYAPWAVLFEAIARAAGGDLRAARAGLLAVPDQAPQPWVWAQADVAEIMRLLGDPSAREQAEKALDAARSLGNDWLAAKALVTLGRLDVADARCSRGKHRQLDALDAIERCHAWLELPSALEGLAAAEVGLDEPARAARLLGAAERFRGERGPVPWPAHADGLVVLTERVKGLLGEQAYRNGADVNAGVDDVLAWLRRGRGERRRPASGWESLTPTEHEVVALAAEGLNNPQIAERLFMSRGTAKRHLGHAFAKLGVVNRAELARYVAQRGEDRHRV